MKMPRFVLDFHPERSRGIKIISVLDFPHLTSSCMCGIPQGRHGMMLYEEILREFQRERVKYILVGGMAVNLLGFPRSTADMDILVEMKDVNVAKVVKILKRQGYAVKQPVDPMLIADKKTRADWIRNKHLKAFNFYKYDELKEVDIILKSPVSYENAKENIVKIRDGNLSIPVISIKDIIKMKRNTGRDSDKMDIDILRRIEKAGGGI